MRLTAWPHPITKVIPMSHHRFKEPFPSAKQRQKNDPQSAYLKPGPPDFGRGKRRPDLQLLVASLGP